MIVPLCWYPMALAQFTFVQNDSCGRFDEYPITCTLNTDFPFTEIYGWMIVMDSPFSSFLLEDILDIGRLHRHLTRKLTCLFLCYYVIVHELLTKNYVWLETELHLILFCLNRWSEQSSGSEANSGRQCVKTGEHQQGSGFVSFCTDYMYILLPL